MQITTVPVRKVHNHGNVALQVQRQSSPKGNWRESRKVNPRGVPKSSRVSFMWNGPSWKRRTIDTNVLYSLSTMAKCSCMWNVVPWNIKLQPRVVSPKCHIFDRCNFKARYVILYIFSFSKFYPSRFVRNCSFPIWECLGLWSSLEFLYSHTRT